MHTTNHKARGPLITIERISHLDAMKGVRKPIVKVGHGFRDKRNDYKRKGKFVHNFVD